MGEQTWSSWVGCLPLFYEFWFSRICNSFIFPSFRGSCLRALGKMSPWFSAEGTLVSEGSCSAPHWPCVVSGQGTADSTFCQRGEYQLQFPMAFRGKRFSFAIRLAFLGGFLFFRLCSPAYWINSERVLNLTFWKKHLYTNVEWARTPFVWRRPEFFLSQRLVLLDIKHIQNAVLNICVRYKEQHESKHVFPTT